MSQPRHIIGLCPIPHAGTRTGLIQELMHQLEDYAEPCGVTAIEGSVLCEGPGQMLGAFTADAAERTGLLLIEAAKAARSWTEPVVLGLV